VFTESPAVAAAEVMGGCSCSRFARFVREWIFNQPRYQEVSGPRWSSTELLPSGPRTPTRDSYQQQQQQHQSPGQRYQLNAGATTTSPLRVSNSNLAIPSPLRKTASKEILTGSKSPAGGFFGKYSLAEEIGLGSTSKVFRVLRKNDSKPFACKVIDKSQARGAEYQYLLQQFAEEVRILELLKHNNVISLEDSFETADRIYIVTELMEGGELFEYVIERGALSEEEASGVVRNIVSAVAYMHSQGVIHRDLKPENLLLLRRRDKADDDSIPEVKIIDFGLARLLPPDDGATSFLGTKGYLAPEMLQRNAYGKSVDVWALGVIAFVLLCGCLPFGDDNSFIENTPHAAKGKFTLRFPSWANNLSPLAKDFLERLLDISPETRISASEACKHSWLSAGVLASSSGGGGGALETARCLGSQRDLLKLSPSALLDAVRRISDTPASEIPGSLTLSLRETDHENLYRNACGY
jgi:serine/threonine protein kinase